MIAFSCSQKWKLWSVESSQQNNGTCLLIDVASTILVCRDPGEFIDSVCSFWILSKEDFVVRVHTWQRGVE